MQPNFKPPFSKFVKKQHLPLQLAIEDAVEEICENFGIGELKTGDLQGIRVFKFTHKKQVYLIAYRAPTDEQLVASGIDLELLFINFLSSRHARKFLFGLEEIPEILRDQS